MYERTIFKLKSSNNIFQFTRIPIFFVSEFCFIFFKFASMTSKSFRTEYENLDDFEIMVYAA